MWRRARRKRKAKPNQGDTALSHKTLLSPAFSSSSYPSSPLSFPSCFLPPPRRAPCRRICNHLPSILTMMLVQKPPSSFLPSSFPVHNLYHHRKNPSAPVVVQPTRTPGLLSLSMAKPAPTRQPQQQQRVNRSPKSKPATAVSQNRSPRPAPAEAQQPTPAPTPDKHVQAQAAAAKPAKDKMTR